VHSSSFIAKLVRQETIDLGTEKSKLYPNLVSRS